MAKPLCPRSLWTRLTQTFLRDRGPPLLVPASESYWFISSSEIKPMFALQNFQAGGWSREGRVAGGGDEGIYRCFAPLGWLVRISSSSLEHLWIWCLQEIKTHSPVLANAVCILHTSRKESGQSWLGLIQHLLKGRWEMCLLMLLRH